MRERRPHPWMSLGQRVIPTTPPPECGTEASPPSPPPKKDPTPDPTDAQVGEGMGEGPDDTVFAGCCLPCAEKQYRRFRSQLTAAEERNRNFRASLSMLDGLNESLRTRLIAAEQALRERTSALERIATAAQRVLNASTAFFSAWEFGYDVDGEAIANELSEALVAALAALAPQQTGEGE